MYCQSLLLKKVLLCVMKENVQILYINEPPNKCNPNLHKYMNPRTHLWIQKEAIEAIGNVRKYLLYYYIQTDLGLPLGYTQRWPKGSPRRNNRIQ